MSKKPLQPPESDCCAGEILQLNFMLTFTPVIFQECCNGEDMGIFAEALLADLICSSVCRWLWSRRLLSAFSRLCSSTFSSSRCLSALRDVISRCCLSRCLSASSCIRASRPRVCWSSSSRREQLGAHEDAPSLANFSFLSRCFITDSILHTLRAQRPFPAPNSEVINVQLMKCNITSHLIGCISEFCPQLLFFFLEPTT